MALDIIKAVMTSFDVRPLSMQGNESVDNWNDIHRRFQPSPEWRLWSAVLSSAVHDLEAARGNRVLYNKQLEWFYSDDEDVGTFRYVCDSVGVDYQAFRRLLRKYLES